MMLLVRRIIADIINILIYLITFILLYHLSSIDTNSDFFEALYYVAFLISFIVPIFKVQNSIGYIIAKLKWENDKNLTIKLLIKFSFPFILLITIGNMDMVGQPAINPQLVGYLSIINNFYFSIIFPVINFFILLISKGKYSIIDYCLNIRLVCNSYVRSYAMTMGMLLLILSIYLLQSAVVYKYNLSSLKNNVQNIVTHEQFPDELTVGEDIIVMKNKSVNVFIPEDQRSYLSDENTSRKTLFVYVSNNVFNSTEERAELCVNLIYQSILNDEISDYHPQQTKIVIAYYKRGFIFGIQTKIYTYYYDNISPKWGIYGGIKIDTLQIRQFENAVLKIKNQVISDREKGLSNKQIIQKYFQEITFSCGRNTSLLKLYNTTINLKKIELVDVKPITSPAFFYFPLRQNYIPFSNFMPDDINANNLIKLKQILSPNLWGTKEEIFSYINQ
jgi:hypothetical protein